MLDLRSLLEQHPAFSVGIFQPPYGALVADDGSGLLTDETGTFTLYEDSGALPLALTFSERFIATVAVAQAAASMAATLREDFRLSVAVTQAAAVPAATIRERYSLAVTVAQGAAVVSATARERFLLSIASTQAAATITASVAERFVLSATPVQAAATIAATMQAAVARPTLSIVVTQAPATIAATLAGGVADTYIPSAPTRRAIPVKLRPVKPLAPVIAFSAAVYQRPAIVSLVANVNDDNLVLEMLELLAA